MAGIMNTLWDEFLNWKMKHLPGPVLSDDYRFFGRNDLLW